MHDIECEVYGGKTSYKGKLPSSKIKFAMKNLDYDMDITLGMENAEKVYIDAAEAGTESAHLGKISLKGPLVVKYSRGTETSRKGLYESTISDLVDKEYLNREFKKQFGKMDFNTTFTDSRGTKKYNFKKGTSRMKLRFDNFISKLKGGSMLDESAGALTGNLKGAVESMGSFLADRITNFDGKVYFESEDDYKKTKKHMKKNPKQALSDIGKLSKAYEITWFLKGDIIYDATCE